MNEAPTKKILVTGASGYIGGRLIPHLLTEAYRVRCVARRPDSLQGRAWSGVEIVQGDVLVPESLPPALQDVDTAYYLIHSMAAGESGFSERDRLAARNFAEAARQAGVSRIVYLGALGSHDTRLSAHLKSRQEVGDILRASDIPVTEFRAAVIVGSGSLSFEMVRYLTERLPIMICPQWLRSRIQPIAIRDVLNYLVQALENDASRGQIIEIGGADRLTYGDMIRQYAEVRGLKRYLIEIPVLTPRLSSYWVDLVTPIPTAVSRPLIEGLRNDVICHSDLARKIFPITPLSYKEAVELALQRISENDIETIWSGAQSSLQSAPTHATTLSMREGMIIESRKETIEAPADKVFKVFSGIGGRRGWFYANWLWKLRGFIDRLVGGVGMRRGRRHPDTLRLGDVIDCWRVEKLENKHLLRLRAEMKLPGQAWLQFEVTPLSASSSQLTQIAFYDPKGLGGLFYWYTLYPFHRFIFSGLCRAIAKRSYSLEA